MLSIEYPQINVQMEKICQALASQSLAAEYYLAGGTALALQIKHRKSIDLDFFTPNNIDAETITAWLDHLFPSKDVEIVFRKIDQFDVKIMGVKTSFIHYPFAIINSLIEGEAINPLFSGLRISSAQEIGLMKAYALGRRTSFRDYIDLYYLIKNRHTNLEHIINACSEKYVVEKEKIFSGKLFLQQLVYTEDVTDKNEALSFVFDKSLTVETIETFLNNQVAEYIRSLSENDQEKGDQQ